MPRPDEGPAEFLHDPRWHRETHMKHGNPRTKENTIMHLCIVCHTRPAQDTDAAFCGDACAAAWTQDALALLARVRVELEREVAAESAVGPEMAAHVVAAHDEASITGLWN